MFCRSILSSAPSSKMTTVEMVNFQRADGTEVPAYASEKGPKNGLVVIQVNALPANPRSSGPVWRAGQTGLHLCR